MEFMCETCGYDTEYYGKDKIIGCPVCDSFMYPLQSCPE